MMAHEMIITLTDDDYAELAAQAAQSGKPVESLARDLLSHSLSASTLAPQPLSTSQFTQRQYQDGKILNLPTHAPLTAQKAADREQRARLLSGGKPASEMVIEDRGPR
jgi:plasmid stability protein